MYKTLLLLITLLIPATALAQQTEDVVYLKNGGVLRGEIIEYTGDGALRIQTAGRNVFVVRMEEVREIIKEPLPDTKHYKTSGYVNQTGLAILPGNENVPVRVQMTHGYQFNPKLSAGLGLGFILYNDEPLNLVPFYLDLRYRMLEANATPFLFFKSGRSFSILTNDEIGAEDHSGGFMLNTGLGIQFDTGAGVGWYLSAGYHQDNSSYRNRLGGRFITTEISHRRVQFGFGLSF